MSPELTLPLTHLARDSAPPPLAWIADARFQFDAVIPHSWAGGRNATGYLYGEIDHFPNVSYL